jgi:hypothetical protein
LGSALILSPVKRAQLLSNHRRPSRKTAGLVTLLASRVNAAQASRLRVKCRRHGLDFFAPWRLCVKLRQRSTHAKAQKRKQNRYKNAPKFFSSGALLLGCWVLLMLMPRDTMSLFLRRDDDLVVD